MYNIFAFWFAACCKAAAARRWCWLSWLAAQVVVASAGPAAPPGGRSAGKWQKLCCWLKPESCYPARDSSYSADTVALVSQLKFAIRQLLPYSVQGSDSTVFETMQFL
jgi:hypothetical protein